MPLASSRETREPVARKDPAIVLQTCRNGREARRSCIFEASRWGDNDRDEKTPPITVIVDTRHAVVEKEPHSPSLDHGTDKYALEAQGTQNARQLL